MAQLYERAEIYDLINSEERTNIVREDWRQFIGERKIETLLDVSIGTGSMTLPLQELGIEIYGSDLSEAMLDRCGKKAEAKGQPVTLKQSDFRDLSCWEGQQFDCVASTGNSLGYVSNEDVVKTIREMDRFVKPGGYICFDSRNWEKIRKEKQRFYLYNPFFHDGNRINLVQVWDHNEDGSITFNLLYTFERDNRIFQKEIFEEHYHPFPEKLAEDAIRELGYEDIELKPVPWNYPEKELEKMEWYRIIGKKKLNN